jgi:hypothetical protein
VKRALVVVAALALFAGAARADAPAPPAAQKAHDAKKSASCDLVVIHATKTDGGRAIDERLGRLPYEKKPFSDYNAFALLDRQTLALERGKAASYAMVTGRTLRLTWSDMTKDGRYSILAAIDQAGNGEYLKLLEVAAASGEPFFVGGQSYRGGTIIVAISVRP